MATDVLAMAEGYVSTLTAANIRATLDPRDINPPAVLLRPPTMHFRFGRGCIAVDWEARLYMPDSGVAQTLKSGIPLIEQIQSALNFAMVDATPADFQMADGGTVPGFVFTWTTH